MHFDLTNITPAQVPVLGAIATIIASCVAASAAFTVAIVNFYSSRYLVRYRIRCNYMEKMLRPVMDELDDDIRLYRRVIDTIMEVPPNDLQGVFVEVQRQIVETLPGAVRRNTPVGLEYLAQQKPFSLGPRRLIGRVDRLYDEKRLFLNRIQTLVTDWRGSKGGPSEFSDVIQESHHIIRQTIQLRVQLAKYVAL